MDHLQDRTPHPSLRIPLLTNTSLDDDADTSVHTLTTESSDAFSIPSQEPPRVITPPAAPDCTARPCEDDGDPDVWEAVVKKEGMHACNPDQLHWRSDPEEETHGNFKITLRRYLPNFGEHDKDPARCYHCGGIPCPIDHEAQWALRLKDMDFVRDLAEERDKLKEEVRQLNEKLKYFELEKQEWQRTRVVLEGEIERLRNLNDHQQQELMELRRVNKQIKLLQFRLEAAQKEIDKLQVENNNMAIMVSNQAKEIFQLSRDKRTLASQLQASQQKTKELTILLDEAREELENVQKGSKAKDAEIAELKSGLEMLVNELEIQTLVFKDKEVDYKSIIIQLKASVGQLRERGDAASNRVLELEDQLAEFLREIERLRNLLRGNYGFRHYVSIKRNYNDLQEKHIDLLHKVKEIDPGIPPVLKASGRVVTSLRPKSGRKPPVDRSPRLQRAMSAPPRVDRTRQAFISSVESSTET